jgi:hypothetical protein
LQEWFHKSHKVKKEKGKRKKEIGGMMRAVAALAALYCP